MTASVTAPAASPAPAPTPLTGFDIQPGQRNVILGALLVVMLLTALDQTIVSTAMPKIIAQLNGLSLYTWVTTAYLLTSTVMVPIYGKLSDLYGRKPILLIGVSLFLLGSALCGLSGEAFLGNLFGSGMVQLVVFRAIQGLGGAAIMSSAFAVIADIIPPLERGKFTGLFGAVFGLSSVVGPLVGGFLTDHGTATLLGHTIEGWRWVFYVNLPLGLVSLALVTRFMPLLRMGNGKGRIDFLGAALIVATTVPLLLALTWGGTTYAWDSARILGLFAVSAVSLVAFLVTETRVKDPILPLALFRNPVFSVSNVASFIINMAFLGVVMFLPLFMQTVLGITATNSGFTLLPLMAGLIASSIVAGQLVARTGRYKPVMLGGGVILLLGAYSLTGVGVDTTQFGIVWRMVILGLGLGPAQSLFTLAIQNAVPREQTGVATSASQFFRQMGSTIGLAVFGTVLTSTLSTELPRYLPQIPGMATQKVDMGSLQGAGLGGSTGTADRITAALDKQNAVIEAALRGDKTAAAQALQNTALPTQLRDVIAGGGIAAQVRTGVEAQAAQIQTALTSGSKQRLNTVAQTLPEPLKTQLSQVPAAVIGTPAATALAAQIRAGMEAQLPTLTERAVTTTMTQVRAATATAAKQLTAKVSQGTKLGFSASVRHLFWVSFWIIALGLIITGFVPEVPMRAQPKGEAPAAAPAH
ncbi:DHA2 family efflux MFS transporter permease subunit [Deinococcus sp. KSM4-11]|uniref:MDR family MFS transporter n=1 Tax=Deinococcus sp. KSM4-11 TaxID=2568654 RepID=UPI0010A58ACC|nr:MDR family MFS transporter [Deinococcus sp. KSM4-11]THF85004.1 DHA2 family efflux MFS transporter permease subunit [Deinococcus sp. KSM4-11]